jgi:hypothetical protein
MFYRTFPLAYTRALRTFPLLFRILFHLADGKTVNEIARAIGRNPYDLGLPLCCMVEMGLLEMRKPAPAWYTPHAQASRADQHYGSKLVGHQTRQLPVVTRRLAPQFLLLTGGVPDGRTEQFISGRDRRVDQPDPAA